MDNRIWAEHRPEEQIKVGDEVRLRGGGRPHSKIKVIGFYGINGVRLASLEVTDARGISKSSASIDELIPID